MRHGRPIALALLATLGAAATAAAAAPQDRYSLAQGCYALTSGGRTVAGPFRMKPTALGSYLLYTTDRRFFARTGDGTVGPVDAPSADGDWTVAGAAGAFTLSVQDARLTESGGKLSLGGAGSPFGFAPATGCPAFPESQVGVTGAPSRSATPWGTVGGFLDPHMHWMAYEFLGGRAHCGKPWDRFGIASALVDCPDHSVPGSPGNVLEAALGGPPTHKTDGWPTFGYWPNYYSLTHEDTYYRWVERAWRAGLRLVVNLNVDNAALCKVFPLKSRPSCNEMDTVRLEIRRMRELQDYVDAQSGGPGRGWLRIVASPFQARRVIASGKLAVVQGIETSQLFDCNLTNGVPNCDRAKIDRNLEAVYRAGVRSMQLANKFDNAFVGVAGDGGTQGPIVNNGNKLETGQYWDMKTCQGVVAGDYDKTQMGAQELAQVPGFTTTFAQLFPAGQIPVYPPPPLCNQRGLSELGRYLLDRMMARGMLIDPDHMSVFARNATLDLLEARRYSGVLSSHSWSTDPSYPRIYRLGGVVTTIGSSSKDTLADWRKLRAMRDRRYYFGFGFGDDMNGFHVSGAPRRPTAASAVTYPFRSWDGKQTISRLTTGQRTWDVNTDGVANFGLYPDWIEDLRKLGGNAIVRDFGRGAEAYLQTWERAVGVPAYRPVPSRSMFDRRGLFRVGLGVTNQALLRSAGQPLVRGSYVWRWGIQKRPIPTGSVAAVIGADGRSTVVASTGREHSARGVKVGDPARRIGGAARVAPGVRLVPGGTRFGYLYGVRAGRVAFTGVTSLRGRALRVAAARLRLL